MRIEPSGNLGKQLISAGAGWFIALLALRRRRLAAGLDDRLVQQAAHLGRHAADIEPDGLAKVLQLLADVFVLAGQLRQFSPDIGCGAGCVAP